MGDIQLAPVIRRPPRHQPANARSISTIAKRLISAEVARVAVEVLLDEPRGIAGIWPPAKSVLYIA
jgi:hypothetical protein